MTPKGKARYIEPILVITMFRQKGDKIVEEVTMYNVQNLNPDPKVAFPAFSLTKPNGDSWHISVNEHGPSCTCPHATYRGSNARVPCKHIAAARAVGLLPGEENGEEEDQVPDSDGDRGPAEDGVPRLGG